MVNSMILIDADEFARLYRVDARMDALISYIETHEKSVKDSKNRRLPMPISSLDHVKAIIGMCDE